jgi:Nucleotide modification associated domain 3
MKIIFSRKGFDSTSGGAPSPIINGVPHGLPIPTDKYPSETTYNDLGLGAALSKVQNRYTAKCLCHEDPMFWDDKCAFGQTGASQGILKNRRVGDGDVFLFFGLFSESGSDDLHHRIFGYLDVERKFEIDAPANGEEVWRRLEAEGAPRRHPHTIATWDNGGKWHKNNTIYMGRGRKAKKACDILRLTKPAARPHIGAFPNGSAKLSLPNAPGAGARTARFT